MQESKNASNNDPTQERPRNTRSRLADASQVQLELHRSPLTVQPGVEERKARIPVQQEAAVGHTKAAITHSDVEEESLQSYPTEHSRSSKDRSVLSETYVVHPKPSDVATNQQRCTNNVATSRRPSKVHLAAIAYRDEVTQVINEYFDTPITPAKTRESLV